jgi:hypothetical protein
MSDIIIAIATNNMDKNVKRLEQIQKIIPKTSILAHHETGRTKRDKRRWKERVSPHEHSEQDQRDP